MAKKSKRSSSDKPEKAVDKPESTPADVPDTPAPVQQPAASQSPVKHSAILGYARDLVVALVAAGLILAATPPISIWPLGLLGLIVLHLGTRDVSASRAAVTGWVAGFVVNAVAFSWGADLLRRFVHTSSLEGAQVVIGMAAYQAGVFALWVGLTTWVSNRFKLSRIVVAPLAIVIAESAVPFVFPWYLAIVVAPAWPLLQVAELGGPVAVSGLIVLLTAIAAEALLLLGDRGASGAAAPVARIFAITSPANRRQVGIGAIVAAGVLGLGLARAGQVALARQRAPHLRVGVVQPNFGLVSPTQRSERGQQYIRTLRTATDEVMAQGAELVVWPESAFPFLFDRDLDHEFAVGHPWELRTKHKGRLLVGALTHEFGTSVVYNSAVLVGESGAISGIYDKTRLLAFGEYIPFAERYPDWAERMRKRMEDWPEIVPGTGPHTLVDGNLRIAPLICYEDLLPEYVEQAARQKESANLLVTSANHAWFGTTAAAKQAFALALLRGVEVRRDFVRATATGVSSVSDALGRVSHTTTLTSAAPDSEEPPDTIVADVALLELHAAAPYTSWLFPWACGIGLIWAAIRAAKRRDAA